MFKLDLYRNVLLQGEPIVIEVNPQPLVYKENLSHVKSRITIIPKNHEKRLVASMTMGVATKVSRQTTSGSTIVSVHEEVAGALIVGGAKRVLSVDENVVDAIVLKRSKQACSSGKKVAFAVDRLEQDERIQYNVGGTLVVADLEQANVSNLRIVGGVWYEASVFKKKTDTRKPAGAKEVDCARDLSVVVSGRPDAEHNGKTGAGIAKGVNLVNDIRDKEAALMNAVVAKLVESVGEMSDDMFVDGTSSSLKSLHEIVSNSGLFENVPVIIDLMGKEILLSEFPTCNGESVEGASPPLDRSETARTSRDMVTSWVNETVSAQGLTEARRIAGAEMVAGARAVGMARADEEAKAKKDEEETKQTRIAEETKLTPDVGETAFQGTHVMTVVERTPKDSGVGISNTPGERRGKRIVSKRCKDSGIEGGAERIRGGGEMWRQQVENCSACKDCRIPADDDDQLNSADCCQTCKIINNAKNNKSYKYIVSIVNNY